MKSEKELIESLSDAYRGDESLVCINIQDVVDTVYHNEQVRDTDAVRRVFRELLAYALTDAEWFLDKYMSDILHEINS